jgi:hypothetical protein
MDDKHKNYFELTSDNRKAMFHILSVSRHNGEIPRGEKVKAARNFNVAPRTVSRV